MLVFGMVHLLKRLSSSTLHYRYRLGHVVIGALAHETAACREDILHGIESISQQ